MGHLAMMIGPSRFQGTHRTVYDFISLGSPIFHWNTSLFNVPMKSHNTELSNYQAAQTVKLLKLLSSAAPATVAPVEPQQ